MHNLFGLIFILSSVIFYKPEIVTEPPQLTREEIKNLRIKSITEYKISEVWGISEKNRLQTEKISYYEYDTSGNMVSTRAFNDDRYDIRKNLYDSNGNNIEYKFYRINDSDTTLLMTCHSKYDKNNICIEYQYSADSTINKHKYIYNTDSNGRIIYDRNEYKIKLQDDLSSKENYIIWKNNKIFQYISIWNEYNERPYKDSTYYLYDTLNRLISEIYNNVYKREYTYDENCNLISEYRYKNKVLEHCCTYYYDSQKRIIMILQYHGIDLDEKETYSYGKNNQILEYLDYHYRKYYSNIENDSAENENIKLGKQNVYKSNDTIGVTAARVRCPKKYYDYYVLPTIYKYEYEYYEKEGMKK